MQKMRQLLIHPTSKGDGGEVEAGRRDKKYMLNFGKQQKELKKNGWDSPNSENL